MPPRQIGLRDNVNSTRQALGLSTRQFELLTATAKTVHRKLCARRPDSDWANPNLSWRHLPLREKDEAIQDLLRRCRHLDMFIDSPATGASEPNVILEGLSQRLQQTRRNWCFFQRSKYRDQWYATQRELYDAHNTSNNGGAGPAATAVANPDTMTGVGVGVGVGVGPGVPTSPTSPITPVTTSTPAGW